MSKDSNHSLPLALTLALFSATLWLSHQSRQPSFAVSTTGAPEITGEKPASLDGMDYQALRELGHAWMLDGVHRKNPASFRHAARVFLVMRNSTNRAKQPKEWALASHLLGTAQMNEGDSFKDATMLAHAENNFRAALKVWHPVNDAAEWSWTRHHMRRVIMLPLWETRSPAAFSTVLTRIAAMSSEGASTAEDRSDTLANKADAYHVVGLRSKDRAQKLVRYKTALAYYAEARRVMPNKSFAYGGETYAENEANLKRYIDCVERNKKQTDLIALLEKIEEAMLKKI
jgi:hypothetical protein